jgi:ATP-citrate lyase alpha-subunit
LELAATFPGQTYITLAKQVEELTLEKKPTLILNVDGHVAALLLDMFVDIGMSDDEIEQMIEAGICNALFVLARSIGFIGHYLDQQRLNEGLHRTPWEDIMYGE